MVISSERKRITRNSSQEALFTQSWAIIRCFQNTAGTAGRQQNDMDVLG